MYAVANKSEASITLHWSKTSDAISFNLYKRAYGASNWGTPIATRTAAEDTFYTDENLTLGEKYQYALEKITNRAIPNTSNIYTGYGYVTAAIENPPMHERGVMWVLISQIITDSLSNEIETLINDLAADGWNVYKHTVPSSDGVLEVKDFIKSSKESVGCDAIYLLGHIPVPYSGTYCTDANYQYPPDGHTAAAPPSHCGAWPSDVFYGALDGSWTDTKTDSTGKRQENKNIPGDGKYDNIRIPGEVTVAIGRVDFYNMPLFSMSEVQLTKQYLDKTHKYKIGETIVLHKGIIEDNFKSVQEGFSSGAIRDFTAVLGENGVLMRDLFSTTDSGDYLLSYTCGPGSYTSCGGVGTSSSFLTSNSAAFNHMFGSYFGDFDNKNNMLRASLATPKLGFTNMWSGRPKWVTNTLGLGDSYADVVKLSQNTWLDYDASYYQNGTHMNLLGDPSMRHDIVISPSNINLTANSENSIVNISWDASLEGDIEGYFVYRSHKPHGGYILLNSTPITELEYSDSLPYKGTNHYMVRTAKKTITGSGSYINLSLGISSEINGLNGTIAHVSSLANDKLKVYPTLASDHLNIETKKSKSSTYKIISINGTEVLCDSINSKKTRIDISTLPQGMYIILIDGSSTRFVKH